MSEDKGSPFRALQWRMLIATASVSLLGFVLAFTIAPGAINMGLGVGVVALIVAGLMVFDR